MLSKLVIVGLVVVWGFVLLPDVLSRFSRGRRGDTIRSFSTQLSSLGRVNSPGRPDNVIDLRSRAVDLRTPSVPTSDPAAAPRTTAVRRQPRPAESRPVRRPAAASARPSAAIRKRRQDVLVALGSAAVLTLLATVAFGGAFLYLHLLVDVALAAYLVLLAQVTSPSANRAPATRRSPRESMAPIGPFEGLHTGTVGRAVPAEVRRVAN